MSPFPYWIDEVGNDELLVDPTDIQSECSTNLWSFSLSPENHSTVTRQDVESFINAILHIRSQQLQERKYQPQSMIFYCWHDEQAGQLRFSMISAGHGYLPFGCTIENVTDINIIINAWLNSAYLHGIPWVELSDNDHNLNETDSNREHILQVWTMLMP